MSSSTDRTQRSLLALAGLFVTLYTLALTLAPLARPRAGAEGLRWDYWIGWLIWGLAWLGMLLLTERRLPERDPYLTPVVALLTGWGLLTIWRLIPSMGMRQALWLAAGIGVCAGAFRFNLLEIVRRYKYLWLSAGLLLTGLTLLWGTNPMGAGPRLWLGCCGIYLQPSEPLKLLLIIYLSAYLAEHWQDAPSINVLLPTIIVTGLTLALALAQRDLGAASILLFLYAMIVYAATAQKRILLICLLALAAAALGGYALFDVVRLRVDAWLNPWLDPSGRSYQIVQSLLAVASGGLSGRGPGLGSPAFVPVPHSDFIFAAIAEESGLPGALGLLGLLALLVTRGLRAALTAAEPYHAILAAGLSAYLGGQSILIIGGNLRLLPLTGVTLPFVSYGGSSLLVSLLALALLLQISQCSGQAEAAPGRGPYLAISGQLNLLLLGGFAALALLLGWWSVARGPALLTRTDNPRRALDDRYVLRGRILDRSDQPLAETRGERGDYTRYYPYPALGPLLGYNYPLYGQAGLEASLDPYLRGLKGHPELTIWWQHLLYGQPPPGVDVRLTLDLDIQRAADQLLGEHTGALALLDAQNGEILALASHPGFDGNLVETQMENYIQDEGGPLLNRATLGLYPLGEALSLWGGADPQALGLLSAPDIQLPTVSDEAAATASEGSEALRASPLQVAIAASVLSSGGLRPAARLVQAVNTSLAGWVFLPPSFDKLRMPADKLTTPSDKLRMPADEIMTPDAAAEITRRLADAGDPRLPIWRSVVRVPNGEAGWVAWYIGGTLPGQGTPTLALAVLIEADNPEAAQAIGHGLFEAIFQP